jgi:hypothetical protein
LSLLQCAATLQNVASASGTDPQNRFPEVILRRYGLSKQPALGGVRCSDASCCEERGTTCNRGTMRRLALRAPLSQAHAGSWRTGTHDRYVRLESEPSESGIAPVRWLLLSVLHRGKQSRGVHEALSR